MKQYTETFGPLKIPLMVGILPLANARHAAFLHHEVPGILIPDPIQQKMAQSGEENSSVGIKIAIELIQQVRGFAQGIYFMPPFRRYDMVAEIIDQVRADPAAA